MLINLVIVLFNLFFLIESNATHIENDSSLECKLITMDDIPRDLIQKIIYFFQKKEPAETVFKLILLNKTIDNLFDDDLFKLFYNLNSLDKRKIGYAEEESVLDACKKGNLRLLKFAQSYGIDFTKWDGRLSALAVASEKGYLAIVRFLLDEGYPFGDCCDFSPMAGVVANGHTDCLKLLCEELSKMNSDYPHTWLALMTACAVGNKECAEIAINYGADINFKAERCELALLVCARKQKHLPMMMLLLNKGAGVNEVNSFGLSALHRAVEKGNKAAVIELLKHGADVNQASGKGFTPLHCAVLSENKDILLLLLERGADPHCRDRKGRKPIDHAKKVHNVEIEKILQNYEKND